MGTQIRIPAIGASQEDVHAYFASSLLRRDYQRVSPGEVVEDAKTMNQEDFDEQSEAVRQLSALTASCLPLPPALATL
ncbi:hypothetical protein VP1G_11005 [Cytospora mali]|uniref:Uncharacterized protein n=1 Tax=Cytospora mali TaxID=578113 RepID=A0A194V2X1_CYTMA|nr:hypothetical protein VP1G_11005 [Valsa mali var. pyri (nom. inval.)]